MNLTNEEKKIIVIGMKDAGWAYSPIQEWFLRKNEKGEVIFIDFSLNDAWLVVDELGRNGQWREFFEKCIDVYFASNPLHVSPGFLTAWLLTMHNGEATNFFRAFATWVKENEG